MAKITYVQPDDRAQTFDVPAGHSIMEGAFRNNVEGIIAECGGSCPMLPREPIIQTPANHIIVFGEAAANEFPAPRSSIHRLLSS